MKIIKQNMKIVKQNMKIISKSKKIKQCISDINLKKELILIDNKLKIC